MRKFFGLIKQGWNIYRINFWTLLIFELVYKLIMLNLFNLLIDVGVKIGMHAEHLSYLSDETVKVFLKHPLSWVILLVYVLVLAVITMFDIACITVCFHASYHGQKLPFMYMINKGLRVTWRMISRCNVVLVVYLVLIVPLTYAGSVSGYAANFTIPEFIQDYIASKKALAVLCIIFWLFLWFKSQQWLYGIHYFTLERMSYKKARNRSERLIKGNYVKDTIAFVVWLLACSLLYTGVVKLMEVQTGYLCTVLADHAALCSLLLGCFSILGYVWSFLGCGMGMPLVYLLISVLYYHRKEQKHEKIPPKFERVEEAYLITQSVPAQWLKKYRARIISLVIVVCLGVGFAFNLADRNGFLSYTKAENIQVCAHRGYAAEYPENTIPAFKGAIEIGADWIELDVQQTKDGVLVISHDSNLMRTTGHNINIYDADYDEIKDLDVGSWFNLKFQKVKLATLDQVLKTTKDKINVIIEIKLTGHETDIEKEVVDLIHEYEMEDQCVVASMQYAALENTKKADSEIRTAYITSVSYGDFSELTAADAYNVEQNMLTKSFIRKAHKNGKQVYVWTVNTERLVRLAIDQGADVILSDNPVMVQKVIADRLNNTAIGNLLQNVQER